MFNLIVTILFFIATCARGQEIPPNPIPSIPKSLGMSMVDYINLERFKMGLKEVTYSDQLICAASIHATYISNHNQCTHYGPRLQSFADRVKMCGGVARYEVIACGFTDFVEVVAAWAKDPSHRNIIFDPEATQIGGAAVGNKWVVVINK